MHCVGEVLCVCVGVTCLCVWVCFCVCVYPLCVFPLPAPAFFAILIKCQRCCILWGAICLNRITSAISIELRRPIVHHDIPYIPLPIPRLPPLCSHHTLYSWTRKRDNAINLHPTAKQSRSTASLTAVPLNIHTHTLTNTYIYIYIHLHIDKTRCVCARNINNALATQFQLEFCLVLIDNLSLTIIKFSLRWNTGGEVRGPGSINLGLAINSMQREQVDVFFAT